MEGQLVSKDSQILGVFVVVPYCKVSVTDFNFLDLCFLNDFMRTISFWCREVFVL